MCYVEAATGGDGGSGDGGDSKGSLVTVTSAGGVHVWGVPAFDVVGTEGTGQELAMPLLATHSLKVGGDMGCGTTSAGCCWHCMLVGGYFARGLGEHHRGDVYLYDLAMSPLLVSGARRGCEQSCGEENCVCRGHVSYSFIPWEP